MSKHLSQVREKLVTGKLTAIKRKYMDYHGFSEVFTVLLRFPRKEIGQK